MTALVPILLLAAAVLIGYLLVRSNERLKQREEARGQVEVEEFVPALTQWPARPRPAVNSTHPRAMERIVPRAGGRG